jgi:hypothetical protein
MRKAIVPAAAVMALLAIGDSASAQPKFDSKVTIHAELAKGGVQRFFGEVKSGKNACEPNRKVILYHTLKGNPEKVGSVLTNGHGEWELNDEVDSPVYFARVKPRAIDAGVCKGDRSRNIQFM